MEKKKLKKFKLLARLTKQRNDLAARSFAEAKQKLDLEGKKLEELKFFELDYTTQLRNKKSVSIRYIQLEQYHNFFNYLNSIIEKQNSLCGEIQQEVDRRKQIWLQNHKQNEALKEYIESVEKRINSDKERKEQKELDIQVNDFYTYLNRDP